MLLQVPAPPLPPELPVIPGGGPPEWIAPIFVVTLIVLGVVFFPLVRAIARRIEGGRPSPALSPADLDELHERLESVERLEARLQDVESRLEFSERLLASQRQAQLERPGAP